MFYRTYLQALCARRHWNPPQYEAWEARQGYLCKVRVNNREYRTRVPYATEDLAQDNAAMQAWMIVRDFSANDGMYPGQRAGRANGSLQGIPVAIGCERKGNRNSTVSTASSRSTDSAILTPMSSLEGYMSVSSASSPPSSGGNSPQSVESSFDAQMQHAMWAKQWASPRYYQHKDTM